MKKLFISDLDGTLLNSQGLISGKSISVLNSLIKQGMNFTVATARTAVSAVKIISDVNINVPCIFMNGVSIYDINKKEYLKNEYIDVNDSRRIINILKNHGLSAFMYKIENNVLSCAYTDVSELSMYDFYILRRDKYEKPFIQAADLLDVCNDYVVYFSMTYSYDKLVGLKNEISQIKNLKFEFYKDVYSKDLWYLEIFSSRASKYNGVQYLRDRFGFSHVTAFGDNLNDIPLFKASDVKVAVANARDELKAIADYIAEDNDSDGVANWLMLNKE